MNQFAHFTVTKDLCLQNDDVLFNESNHLSSSEQTPENSPISTEAQSLEDKYAFYTSNSLSKQIFHVNEMIMSSGGTRGYFKIMA